MRQPIAILLPVLLIFLTGATAQLPQRIIPAQKHDVSVRLTLVDVIVTRKGEFVKDLTRKDFELYEDGQRVSINSFELVSYDERDLKLPEESEPGDSTPIRGKRLAVIFDSINTWNRELAEGGRKIIDELVALIQLGHEVMILELDRGSGISVLQSFTTDAEEIRRAVVQASGRVWKLGQEISSAYERQTEAKPLTIAQQMFLQRLELDRDQTAIEQVLQGSYYEDMQRIEFIHRERQRFQQTVGGILAAFNLMKSLPGRKAILLISAGIPDLSPPDMFPNIRSGVPTDEFHDPYQKKIFGKMDHIQVFDPFNILGEKVFGSGEEVIREIIHFANAHNISVYSMDSGIFVRHLYSGASAEHYQPEEMAQFRYNTGDKIRKVQNLRWLSEDTGADSLRGSNRIDDFRDVMGTDLNYHYQLSFYPKRPEADDRYHKIDVKVKRRGVKVRFRRGYTDYTEAETNKMQLVSAFYNPSLYKQLPFKAELIPFVSSSGKYQPWINVALPAGDLIRDRFIDHAPKTFLLHIWINDLLGGDDGYGGRVSIALNLSPSFMDFIRNIEYLSYHFIGPEFNFDRIFYRGITALTDPLTAEIGTQESPLIFPNLKKTKDRFLVNCVAGELTETPQGAKEEFTLSQKDGGLDYGPLRFFPKVTNQFKPWENIGLFLQVFLPSGRPDLDADFVLDREGRESLPIPGELKANQWNKAARVWSGLFSLDLMGASTGEGNLKVKLTGKDGEAVFTQNIEVSLIR